MGNSSSKYAWMAYGSTCLMMICWSGLVWGCMGLYADPVVTELGVTRTGFMFTITMFALTNAVLSIFFYGKIEEALGIRKMAIIGGVLSCIGLLMEAFMWDQSLMYIGGVFIGAGVSLVTNNTCATIVNHWFKRHNATLISGASLIGSIAAVVWALVIASLIAAIGWRSCFTFSAAVVAIFTVVCAFLYKGNPPQVGVAPLYSDNPEVASAEEVYDGEKIPFKAIFKTYQFWLIISGSLLGALAIAGFYSTLPLFCVDLGHTEAQGYIISVARAATAIVIIPMGLLADKYGSKWMIALACVCGAVGYAMLLSSSASDSLMLYAIAILSGIAYFLVMVPIPVAIKEAFGNYEYSKKLGFCFSFSTLGCAFGGTVLNSFYDLQGTYETGIIVCICFIVYAAVALFFGTRRVHLK